MKRRKNLLLLTRFVGLLLIAGLTVGVFFALRIGRPHESRRNVKELFEEAEGRRGQGDAAVARLDALRVKYEKVVRAAPKSPWAQRSLLRLAVLERTIGNTRAAFGFLYRNINAYPESNLTAQARYMVGRIWHKDVGDLDRALTSYRTVVSMYLPVLRGETTADLPEYARPTVGPGLRSTVLKALAACATVQVEQGDYQAAAETLNLAVTTFADDPNPGETRALCQMLKMRLADIEADHLDHGIRARSLWSEVLREDQRSPWAPVAEKRLKYER